MKGKFQFSLFRKFLISYLLFLVLTLLSGAISYRVADRAITESSEKTSLMMLNQSKDFVDHLMQGIQSLSREISTNDEISTYVNGGGMDAGVYNTWKAWRSLAPYHFSSDVILSFYIYTKSNNLILTPQGPYVRLEDFYGLFRYNGMTMEQWKAAVLDKIHQDDMIPSSPFVMKGQELNVITYANTISFGHDMATLVILIDEREVQKLLSRNTSEYGGWIRLTDSKGQIIASYGDMPDQGENGEAAAGKDTLLIQTKSEYNGWTYTAGLSKSKVLGKALYIRNVTVYILMITTAVSLVIALLFSYRNSAPLNELASLLRDYIGAGSDTSGKNGFDFLKGNVTQLIRNYRALEEDMSRQLPVLREAYIGRLLSGKPADQEDEYAHEQLGIRFQGPNGYVCLLHVHGLSRLQQEDIHQMNVSRLIIRKVVEELFGQQIVIGDDRTDQLALLWTSARPPERDELHSLNGSLHQLANLLNQQYGIRISISVGGGFQALTDVYRSYYEARQAMEHALSSPSKIVWYEQLPAEMGSLYYPIDLEMRLMASAKSGDWAEVGAILERIYEENISVRQVSGEMFKQLAFELKGTAYKLITQIRNTEASRRLQELAQRISPQESPELVREAAEQVFRALCESAGSGQHKDQTLTERLIAYLQTNYSSSQLSLAAAADHVQLPEKYISQVFKEQVGENFSVYLEKLRIQRAAELLSSGQHTIEEIAERVGYNSAHAFRRAFKRATGAPPSVYRTIAAADESQTK